LLLATHDTATDEILAVIAGEEPRGATAAQVARAIGLGFDETLMGFDYHWTRIVR